MANLANTTHLNIFKTMIEQAVALLPAMNSGEKVQAVQFVSKKLQEIVLSVDADITELTVRYETEKAKYNETVNRSRSLSALSLGDRSTYSDSSEPLSDHNSGKIHIREDSLIEELINHPVLHEKIAEKINRVFNGECVPIPDSNNMAQPSLGENSNNTSYHEVNEHSPDHTLTEEGCMEANEIKLPETTIQDILNGIENDSVFTDFLNICSAKRDILSSPIGSTFSPLNTPKTNKFRSPFSSPIRPTQYSKVVKDLMKELKTPEKCFKTPEKRAVQSSPLSAAIQTAINDSHFNISQASAVMPALDLNTFLDSQLNNPKNSKATHLTTTSLPLQVQAGNCTYVLKATSSQELCLSSTPNSHINKAKNLLKHKRINVDRIKRSNIHGLKRKFGKLDSPVLRPAASLRKIAPKPTNSLDQIAGPSSQPKGNNVMTVDKLVPRSNVRVNLKRKFDENLTKASEGSSPGPQSLDAQLLNNMDVDQFLSSVHHDPTSTNS